MRSTDSIRNRLALSTLLVLSFALTLPSAREFEPQELGRHGGDLRGPVGAPANVQPVPEHAELEKADTTADDRESFLLQTRLADLRREYAMYLPADDVIRLLAAGDSATAVTLLLERAKANDLPAAIMLLTLALQCGQPPELPVASTTWDWYAKRAREIGRSEEVRSRISWLREDESERERYRQYAACSIEDDDAAAAMLVLLGGLAATRQELDEAITTQSLDALLTRRYRTLGAHNPFLEYVAATRLLRGTEAAQRTEGLALLQNAALTLPAAKTALAMCYIDDCTRSGTVPDSGATMSLLKEAGLAGDFGAIRFLALGIDALGGDIPEPHIGEASPSDWAEVRDALTVAGAFGQAAYINRAITTRRLNMPDGFVHPRTTATATAGKLAHEISELLQ